MRPAELIRVTRIVCEILLGNSRAPLGSLRAIQKIGASRAVETMSSLVLVFVMVLRNEAHSAEASPKLVEPGCFRSYKIIYSPWSFVHSGRVQKARNPVVTR